MLTIVKQPIEMAELAEIKFDKKIYHQITEKMKRNLNCFEFKLIDKLYSKLKNEIINNVVDGAKPLTKKMNINNNDYFTFSEIIDFSNIIDNNKAKNIIKNKLLEVVLAKAAKYEIESISYNFSIGKLTESPQLITIIKQVIAEIHLYNNIAIGNVKFCNHRHHQIFAAINFITNNEENENNIESPDMFLVYLGEKTGREGFGNYLRENNKEYNNIKITDSFVSANQIALISEIMRDNLSIISHYIDDNGFDVNLFKLLTHHSLQKFGLSVDLSKIPIRELGTSAVELLNSTTAGRFLLVMSEEQVQNQAFINLLDRYNINHKIIGKFNHTQNITAYMHPYKFIELPNNIPQLLEQEIATYNIDLKASNDENAKKLDAANIDLMDYWMQLLAHPVTQNNHSIASQNILNQRVGGKLIAQFGSNNILNLQHKNKLAIISQFEKLPISNLNKIMSNIILSWQGLLMHGAQPSWLNVNMIVPQNSLSLVAVIEKNLQQICNWLEIEMVDFSYIINNDLNDFYVNYNIYGINPNLMKNTEFKDCDIYLSGELKTEIYGTLAEDLINCSCSGSDGNYNINQIKQTAFLICQLYSNNLITHAQTIGHGGLMANLTNNILHYKLGIEMDVMENINQILLSEAPGRFILFIKNENVEKVKSTAEKLNIAINKIGKVTGDQNLKLTPELTMDLATLQSLNC
jgi:hypothetical protein